MSETTKKKKVLSADDFLATVGKVKLIEENLDELDGTVFLKPLVAGDMVDYMHSQRKDATPDEKTGGTLRMLTKCVCDADGQPLFASVTVDELRNLPAPLFSKLIALSNKVNGVQESSGDQGKD